MSHERFEQIADLFLRASEHPPQARREFLEGACGGDESLRDEVDSMLRSDARPHSLVRTGAMLALVGAEPPEPPPACIGPYRIVRAIGEGGMGVVYLAEQEHPIRRQVAVKLIRPEIQGRGFIARFEFERQALASMNHPNIARVFDAGETPERRPYLAMEHVAGEPITIYCDARGLGIEERLRLFLEVCGGVAHAHRNAVIHRDLKPSNILVSQDAGTPLPKIIDFGIAKALDNPGRELTAATDIGQLLGTYEYMSPEQLSGGGQLADTRTDVYSLGVVLSELLVGARPFERESGPEASLVDLCRRIREEEPERPSVRAMRTSDSVATCRNEAHRGALARRLRGDLDAIAIKALAKDPRGRYASPSDMAADIERHLQHLPIHARSPGLLVRFRKAIARHRAAAVVVGVLLAALIGTAILGTVQALRAQRESVRAETEARIGNDVRQFIVGVIDPPGALVGYHLRPSTLASWDLDALLDRVREQFADHPLLQSQLLFAIAKHSLAQTRYARGFDTLVESRNRIASLLGPDSAEALATDENLARAYMAFLRFDEAERLLLDALERRRRLGGTEDPDSWRTTALLASLYKYWNRHDQAAPLFEAAIAGLERRLGPDHPDVLSTEVGLSGSYLELHRYAEARVLLEPAIDRIRRVFGERDYQVMVATYNLACAHANLGRIGLALDYLRQANAMGFAYPGGPARDPHLLPLHGNPRFDEIERTGRLNASESWTGMWRDAQSRIREGRFADAERLLLDVIAANERVERNGAGGWVGWVSPRLTLATCWIRQRRFDEAERLLLPTLAKVRAEESFFEEPQILELLAQCDIGRGRLDSALEKITAGESFLRPVIQNVERYYADAQNQALLGREEDALRTLARASALGFDDADRLEHDLAFEKLRARAEFRKIARVARQRAL